MLREKNGYSMIEVLFASSIFFQALIIIIPIYAEIQVANDTLSDKRWAANQLQTELQQFIWGNSPRSPLFLKQQEMIHYFILNL